MKFTFQAGLIGRMGLVGVGALALAACGDSDDASEEVVAEDVEIVAEEPLTDVTEEPVEDEEVAAPQPMPAPAPTESIEDRQATERAHAEDAADRAAAAAADIQAELDAGQTQD